MQTILESLNARYAIPGHVTFADGAGGLLTAYIENEHASAALTLAGAHVMRYAWKADAAGALLWASPTTANTLGAGMRGGAPICWPWFGAHPDATDSLPLHGFARHLLWDLVAARALPDGATELTLRAGSTPETLPLWPHEFALELRATFGERLRLEWTARNPGGAPYRYTGAIHPYYVVSDVRQIELYGLEGADYLDKNEGFRRKTLPGALRFDGPVDYVFLDTTAALRIDDSGLGRSIHIVKSGSRTSVVWNPHDADALQPDVGKGNHRGFVCAEAANAFDDAVTVAPGAEASLSMEIWSETLEGAA